MGFVRLHNDYIMNGCTALENLYISEYMPTLPEAVNRVYIYGLYLCGAGSEQDNTLAATAARLNLTEQDVEASFQVLSAQGLVQLLNTQPIEVRYLPVRQASSSKKYKPEKYADFNTRIQEIITGRVLTPTEFTQYYDFLEYTRMDQDALLLIARYAVTLKDDKIGYSYILTIARNWFSEGIKTVRQVEEKLVESDRISVGLGEIAQALSVKKANGFEERQLYLKWTKGMEYDLDTLLTVAKTCKKGGMKALDAKITRYYAAKLFTEKEIVAYEANKDRLYKLARAVNKTLGLYYEQLDNIVDTYITVWQNMGFDDDTLIFIANVCFKRGVRSLDGLDEKVRSFYKQGLVSREAIAGRVTELSRNDDKIAEVLAAAKSAAAVRTRDRDLYHTWTYGWHLDHDLILYAATLAAGAAQPLPYINKILADWRAKGIDTVEKAKGASSSAPQVSAQAIRTHDYTDAQLNALIDDIDKVEF